MTERVTINRPIFDTSLSFSMDHYDLCERDLILYRRGFENMQVPLFPFDEVYFENNDGETVGKRLVSATEEEWDKYKPQE